MLNRWKHQRETDDLGGDQPALWPALSARLLGLPPAAIGDRPPRVLVIGFTLTPLDENTT